MSDIPEEYKPYWQQRAEEEYPELAGLRSKLADLIVEREEMSADLGAYADKEEALIRRVKMLEEDPIMEEILKIMQTYHEQEATAYGVDTPGGLEHMGDVWHLFLKWEKAILAAKEKP